MRIGARVERAAPPIPKALRHVTAVELGAMVCSYAEAWRDLGARAQLVPAGALVTPDGGARGAAATVLCVSLSLDPSGREARGALRALEQAQPEWLIADWAPSGGAGDPLLTWAGPESRLEIELNTAWFGDRTSRRRSVLIARGGGGTDREGNP